MNNDLQKISECLVCFEDFDHNQHITKIFYKCGHTICKVCMKDLVERGLLERKIRCPMCLKEHKFKAELDVEKIIKKFPTNYDLNSLISLNSRYCVNYFALCGLHKEPLTLMCLEKSCGEKTILCYRCVCEKHVECNKDLVIKCDGFNK